MNNVLQIHLMLHMFLFWLECRQCNHLLEFSEWVVHWQAHTFLLSIFVLLKCTWNFSDFHSYNLSHILYTCLLIIWLSSKPRDTFQDNILSYWDSLQLYQFHLEKFQENEQIFPTMTHTGHYQAHCYLFYM